MPRRRPGCSVFPCSTSSCRSTTSRPRSPSSVRRLHRYLAETLPYPARITIADNASIDDTPRIAAELAEELDGVRVVRLEQKGRGRALHAVWSHSDAPGAGLHGCRPVDRPGRVGPARRPADLRSFRSGDRHPAGPRLTGGARPQARGHLALLQPDPESTLPARFSDAQCGFKAIRADVAQRLLPLVADTGWFFDTELLVLAERTGLRIHEVPVDWVDDPDSRVDIVATATADLKGVGRLLRGFASGSIPVNAIAAQLGRPRRSRAESLFRQVVRFGTDRRGLHRGLSAAVQLLHRVVGAQAANFVALLVTAVANTAANRRFTFGVRGAARAARHHVEGLIVFGIALAITSGSLAGLHAFVDQPHRLSSSPCWCSPTWSPPWSASSCCAAGCFSPAAPAQAQRA